MKIQIKIPLFALCLLAALFRLPALGQGTAFTYQGRLSFNGSPANGSYDFQFIVYDNNPGGAQQGPVRTNAATAVSGGLFTVALDFGQVFPGANRWLDISVRTNGSAPFVELSPRQPLTPTPYAITAGSVIPGGLAGAYGGAVTLSNPANNLTGAFTGNGAGITNVNAAALNGLGSASFWQLGGNNVAGGQFLGSANNQPVEIRANNQAMMRFAYASNEVYGFSPNVIGGIGANFVSNGVVGATIMGGGFADTGSNSVSANFGTVLGGFGNLAGSSGSIAGGINSVASGPESVALGFNSRARGTVSTALGESSASGNYSTAVGGSTATGLASTGLGSSDALGDYSTAAGASDALGDSSTALGGSVASGDYSTALGFSTAVGEKSLAAGNDALAKNDGCFVWADDSSNNVFSSTADNQFLIRAAGGVILDDASQTGLNFGSATRQMINLYGATYGIGVQSSTLYQRSNFRFSWYKGGVHSDAENSPGAGGSVLMTLTSGGLTVNGTLASASDREAKRDFAPVNSREVLDRVAALPITKWIYKTDTGTRHIGPMAQDFYAAFAVGPDDRHITTVDEGGVALAAIQGLNQKLEEQRAENLELKTRLDALEKLVAKLKTKRD